MVDDPSPGRGVRRCACNVDVELTKFSPRMDSTRRAPTSKAALRVWRSCPDGAAREGRICWLGMVSCAGKQFGSFNASSGRRLLGRVNSDRFLACSRCSDARGACISTTRAVCEVWSLSAWRRWKLGASPIDLLRRAEGPSPEFLDMQEIVQVLSLLQAMPARHVRCEIAGSGESAPERCLSVCRRERWPQSMIGTWSVFGYE